TAIASFVINNVSLLFLEIYATTKEVGIFSVAFKVSILISIVLMIVNTIAAPKFSELFWTNRHDELQKVIDFSSKLIFGSALFLAVIIIVFKQFILSLFGNQFIQGDIVLVLLVTGQMINAMTGSTGIFLNMTGHQKTLQHLSILGMILTLGLSYILIPKYGMYGACIAFIVGISIKYIFATWYVQAKHGFKTYYVPFYTRS
ncbi:MAG: polysaccharide biosynthesis C-terminal domain-containing protein, partial [Sulfurimonas sp.]